MRNRAGGSWNRRGRRTLDSRLGRAHQAEAHDSPRKRPVPAQGIEAGEGLFAGGALLIAYLMVWGGEEGDERGIDLFLTILPVAAAIVSFWFAGRMQKGEGDRTGE